jgi:hypothetical protein
MPDDKKAYKAKPSELPVQVPEKFELVINLKTAEHSEGHIPAGYSITSPGALPEKPRHVEAEHSFCKSVPCGPPFATGNFFAATACR